MSKAEKSKKKKFEFNLPRLAGSNGSSVVTKKNLKDVSLKAWDHHSNSVTARVEKLNDDESLGVSLLVDYTGTYTMDVFVKGKSVLDNPLQVTIPCGELEQQAMPHDEIELMSSTGGEIVLSPIVNLEGFRVDVSRDDMTIQVEGGPQDNPLWCTRAAASKNPEGLITLKFAPPLPGHYTLQVLIFDYPLLSPPLRFVVIDDGTADNQEQNNIVNPIVGELFTIPIGDMKDRQGRMIKSWAKPNDLLALMFGPDEFPCKIVYSRNQELLASATAKIEGYYKVDLFNQTTNELILPKPYDLYIGTPELQQQVAYNGNILECSIDGFVLYLNQLTDHKNKPVLYDDSELTVNFYPADKEYNVYPGSAATQENGLIMVTVVPPEDIVGDFRMQVLLRKWPILTRPLRFRVS